MTRAGLGLCASVLLAASGSLRSEPRAELEGTVFVDADADGARDSGERGLSGVVVSNQEQVATTGPEGEYRLPAGRSGVVFVSVPNNYRASGSFWRKAERGRADFGLVASPAPESFTFIHASDTHASADSLPRLVRLREIVAAQKPAFVIVTGDLVKDALRVGEAEARGYYNLFLSEIARFPVAVWCVPGNHEIFGIERHRSLVSPDHPLYGKGMYRALLGPNYYSFTFGGVHFVGLDSVDVDDLWYYGHVDAAQLAWLRADVATLAPATPIVTFNHIPFATAVDALNGYMDDGPAPSLIKIGGKMQYRHSVSNLSEVLDILRPFPWTLALGGHMHTRETIRYESPVKTRFYQTAAVVGPTNGPVSAISGVTLYRVTRGQIDDGTFIPLDSPAATPERKPGPLAHTFSIVARDAATGELGVAVQSHWFSVGSNVAWAEAGVGAVATQSFIEPAYGPRGLELMRRGVAAPAALEELVAKDEQRDGRQVAMIDARGRVSAYTGKSAIAAAGHHVGPDFSAQANLMANDRVWPAMATAFEATKGDLADRMVAALEAGQDAGGDIRGKQSAAIVVVKAQGSGRPWVGGDRVFDLRVDDNPDPIAELRRLLRLQRAYAHANRGDELMTEKNVEAALKEYEAASRLAPEIVELPFWHAVTLASIGREAEAAPIFKAVFAKEPIWADLLPRLPAAGLFPDDPALIERIRRLR